MKKHLGFVNSVFCTNSFLIMFTLIRISNMLIYSKILSRRYFWNLWCDSFIYLDEIIRNNLVPETEGINTTRNNKVELLSRIRFLAETGKLKVWSGMKGYKQFTKEFLNFKIDGSSSVNDDIPMSLAMLCEGISKFGMG